MAVGVVMRAFSLLLSTGLILTGAISVAFAEDSEIITAPDLAVIGAVECVGDDALDAIV